MKWLLECTISGKGEKFAGSLTEAIEYAKDLIQPHSLPRSFKIYRLDNNLLVAQVWEDKTWQIY